MVGFTLGIVRWPVEGPRAVQPSSHDAHGLCSSVVSNPRFPLLLLMPSRPPEQDLEQEDVAGKIIARPTAII